MPRKPRLAGRQLLKKISEGLSTISAATWSIQNMGGALLVSGCLIRKIEGVTMTLDTVASSLVTHYLYFASSD